jgi:hypothetical protein
MSQTDSQKKVASALCRVQIRVERWANRPADGSGFLINPEHLAPVNRALDECIRFMESRSIPTLRQNERLVPMTARDREKWLFEVNPDLSETDRLDFVATMHASGVGSGAVVFHRWRDAVIELKDQWDTYVREAEARLGSRVSETDFPPATDLRRRFIAWGEYDGNREIAIQTILGPYSIFEPPPPPPRDPPSIFEAISYNRDLGELYEERSSGRITQQEFLGRATELNSKYPSG